MTEEHGSKWGNGRIDWADQSGQAMLEYVLVVIFSTIGILLIIATVVRTLLDYYQMQAIWTSLPLI